MPGSFCLHCDSSQYACLAYGCPCCCLNLITHRINVSWRCAIWVAAPQYSYNCCLFESLSCSNSPPTQL